MLSELKALVLFFFIYIINYTVSPAQPVFLTILLHLRHQHTAQTIQNKYVLGTFITKRSARKKKKRKLSLFQQTSQMGLGTSPCSQSLAGSAWKCCLQLN